MNLTKEKGLYRLYLKSCPRCSGDMAVDQDFYGVYKTCIQCGHVVDLDGVAPEKTATPT